VLARAALSCLALAASACTVDEPVGSARLPLDAFCVANVEGVGEVDVETNYLAHVVNCENGAASFEALKAQAVSARSYLYYKLGRGGSIMDGTGDQVYTCGREPGPDHFRAVEETSGEVLQYVGTQVAAFYVAGARQDPPDCRGGTDDPTSTEQWVTYNEGLSGDGLTQTMLGWVDPGNDANRGCMSQNGSHCLAGLGWRYDDILRFYYGEDIELVRAEGACVFPPAVPDAGPAMMLGDAGAGRDDDAGSIPRVMGDVSGGCSASGAGPGPWWVLVLASLLRLRRRPRSRAPSAGCATS
jgi:uncharacterized protein (TIGR03382 family)